MSASMENLMLEVVDNFSKCTEKPDDYLSLQEKISTQLKSVTKNVYDLCKNCETRKHMHIDNSLPELLTKGFDEEQIWQQIELQNDNIVSNLLSNISNVIASKNSLAFTSQNHKEKKKAKKQTQITENLESGSDDGDTDTEINKIKSKLASEFGVVDEESSDDNSNEDDGDFDINRFGQKGQFHSEEENDEEESDGDDDLGFSGKNISKKSKEKKKKSVVDDKFFSLADMESFLVQEDAKEAKRLQDKGDDESSSSSEEDIDMFGDIPSDDSEEKGGRHLQYDDFFDPPESDTDPGQKDQKIKKKVKFQTEKKYKIEESDDEDDDDDNDDDDDGDDDDDDNDDHDDDEEEGDEEEEDNDGNKQKAATKHNLLESSDSEGEDVGDILGGKKRKEKSSFEIQQEKLQKRISKMEEASLVEKPWQLSGEISATQRPENSLLEEHLQCDQAVKLAPVITEETTQSLESIIKQRIKDKAWDDVERKVKPKEDAFEYKKRIVLDQEKSKQSLGEIYEKEYLKQQQGEEEEKTDPQHEEIKSMMQSLFVKLDALSNFHYTPKPAAPEIKIVNNLPSISMEEVAPITHGDGTLLAPEEVKDKGKGELKGATEKSETDRKKERRNKKAQKRKRKAEKERRQKIVEKLNPGLGNKYSKEKAMKELEKSSKMGKGVTLVKDDKMAKNKSLTSSKTFFSQLQEDVSTGIQKKKSLKRKENKSSNVSAKKYKL